MKRRVIKENDKQVLKVSGSQNMILNQKRDISLSTE